MRVPLHLCFEKTKLKETIFLLQSYNYKVKDKDKLQMQAKILNNSVMIKYDVFSLTYCMEMLFSLKITNFPDVL